MSLKFGSVDRAIALYSSGRLQEAMHAVEGLINEHPNAAELHNLSGAIYAGLGRGDQAAASCRRAVEINPEYAEAHNNLGNALKQLGEPAEAIDCYRRALEIDPDYAGAHNNLGNALKDTGQPQAAVASYRQALEINPDHAGAHNNLGNALSELGEYDEAVASYSRALEINPEYADAHDNLGNALRESGQPEAAAASHRKALALNPNLAEAHNNLATTLNELGKSEEAVASFNRALALKPDYADAYNNRGNALKELGKRDAAVASYRRALELDPAAADYHCNLAYTCLQIGDFATGWAEHEWRLQKDKPEKYRRSFTQPLWLGEETLQDRTILLHSEQGYGDTIQFARYAKMVAGKGARVILDVPRALRDLMATLDGPARVVERAAALPAFDYHCPLMSLPLAFNTDIATIPASIPYLFSEISRVATWQKKLGAKTKPRVGLAWSGNSNHTNDHNRSIALGEMFPLLSGGAEWISLQKEVRDSDADALTARNDIRHFGDDLKDFADTAALIDSLDLVILVDTGVAHLAGAMAKPVWLLLPFNADWRWLLERADNPWYPTARLFRQPKAGDWSSVMAQVSDALLELIEGETSL